MIYVGMELIEIGLLLSKSPFWFRVPTRTLILVIYTLDLEEQAMVKADLLTNQTTYRFDNTSRLRISELKGSGGNVTFESFMQYF